MYQFLSRPHKKASAWRPLSGAAVLVFSALSVVAPAQIQHSDARTFSSGLKIKIERNAPPFAALEDTFMDHLDDSSTVAAEKTEALGSANLPAEKVVARIVKGDDPPASQTIAVRSVNREEILQTLFLPLVQSMKSSGSGSVDPTSSVIDSAVSVLPYSGRAGVQFSSASSLPAPDSVARHTVVMPTAAYPSVPLDTQSVHAQAQVTTQAGASADALTQNLSRQITGTIELSEGLALTSPADQIIVYHEVEDAPEGAEGTVWIREGRYRIQLDNLSGLLVAELRSARGELLGRGELDLVNLPLQQSQQYRINDIALKLAPVIPGLAGQTVSGNAFSEQRVVVPQSTVQTAALQTTATADARGVFHNQQVTTGSTVLLQASRPGYWNTLALATADHLNTLVLLPKAFLKSIAQVVKALRPLTQIDRSRAIVWGHVNLNGHGVAGAKVQLLTPTTTTDSSLEPIYFNEMMIPDARLSSTSSNGLYAFIPVAEGPHTVQASVGTHLSEPVAFPAQKQAVSSVDVEMTLSKRLTMKSFDAFEPSHALAAIGAKLGSARSVTIASDGMGFMRYTSGSSLLVMDVDAQAPYTPERFVMSRQKTYMYMPMVKAEWLESLRGGISVISGAATVVGFVQSPSTYHALVDDGSAGSESVVYFDSQGQPTRSGMGEPGGGFAIFNVSEGYRQISVAYDDSDKLSASVILADSHVVSVVNHSMR